MREWRWAGQSPLNWSTSGTSPLSWDSTGWSKCSKGGANHTTIVRYVAATVLWRSWVLIWQRLPMFSLSSRRCCLLLGLASHPPPTHLVGLRWTSLCSSRWWLGWRLSTVGSALLLPLQWNSCLRCLPVFPLPPTLARVSTPFSGASLQLKCLKLQLHQLGQLEMYRA